MRTFENIEYDYKIAKGILDQLQEKLNKALRRTNALYKEMEQYKLNHGMYHSMEELNQYAGKNIAEIELVKKDSNGKLSTEYLYADEILRITSDGKISYSSYVYGLLEWIESENSYIQLDQGVEQKVEYIGYISIQPIIAN